jgi:hypothetical protein
MMKERNGDEEEQPRRAMRGGIMPLSSAAKQSTLDLVASECLFRARAKFIVGTPCS